MVVGRGNEEGMRAARGKSAIAFGASASAKATADGASGAFVSAISEIKPGRSITIELNGLKLNEGWV